MAARRINKKTHSETTREGGSAGTSVDLIVAIGASGAHSRPVEHLLIDLTLAENIAAVLVFQHREALDEERFRQILAEQGRELTLAADGAPLEAGKIYWPAPKTILTLEDGHLQSRAAQ